MLSLLAYSSVLILLYGFAVNINIIHTHTHTHNTHTTSGGCLPASERVGWLLILAIKVYVKMNKKKRETNKV